MFIIFGCTNPDSLVEVSLKYRLALSDYSTDYDIDIEKKLLYKKVFQTSVYIENDSISPERIDTLIVHDYDSFKIEQRDLNLFLRKIHTLDFDTSSVAINSGVRDGSGFLYSQINQTNDTLSIGCWNCFGMPECHREAAIYNAFYQLIQQSSDYDKYFGISKADTEPPTIKKINDSPLEYQILGDIHTEEADDFFTISKNYLKENILFSI